MNLNGEEEHNLRQLMRRQVILSSATVTSLTNSAIDEVFSKDMNFNRMVEKNIH